METRELAAYALILFMVLTALLLVVRWRRKRRIERDIRRGRTPRPHRRA